MTRLSLLILEATCKIHSKSGYLRSSSFNTLCDAIGRLQPGHVSMPFSLLDCSLYSLDRKDAFFSFLSACPSRLQRGQRILNSSFMSVLVVIDKRKVSSRGLQEASTESVSNSRAKISATIGRLKP